MPVTSPVRDIVLPADHASAVSALPVKSAVIVPAVKSPAASRATIVEAVFASVAFEVTVNTPPSAANAPLKPTPATAPSPT